MVIFKCYFSREQIAHSLEKTENGGNIELGKTNILKALCTRSSLPSLVSCKAMMSMPYLTVSSLSSTILVVKQSQFHCRIVRRYLFCSGISVLRSTAAVGWWPSAQMHRDGNFMHLQPSIFAEPVGFPWHTSHGTAAACYADERTSNLS